jgi:hypothetical protein
MSDYTDKLKAIRRRVARGKETGRLAKIQVSHAKRSGFDPHPSIVKAVRQYGTQKARARSLKAYVREGNKTGAWK